MILLLAGSLFVNAIANLPSVIAEEVQARDSPKLTRKGYLRQVDQQLKHLEARIGKLRAIRRSLKGPERDRLSANIRMLRGKLHEARDLWKQMEGTGDDWLDRKKVLEAKVIRLQKSLTYVMNTLS